MYATENCIITLRYGMRNGRGEVLTTLNDSLPFTFLYGSGALLPLLETAVKGMCAGETKMVWVTKEQGFAGIDDDFCFDIIVDDIRAATTEELRLKRQLKNSEDCGDDCDCHK